jgi:putative ABC transport system ATP-binding protein
MTKELLRLDDISKEYRMDGVVFQALKNITISVHEGEFVAIMGPSGSGKSTLMHIIGCLDRPTSGKVLIEGRDVMEANEKEMAEIRNTHIGFVFQQFNLLRKTTAEANVELPLVYARIAPKDRKKRAMDMLTLVGLSEKTSNFASQLSGGQQQRVAIARALVTNPSIILADEPTGNLDSKSGKDIMDLFKKLHSEGKTIIIVTHDESIAQNARRIIRVTDGEVLKDEMKKAS